jgi:hypothetical protein
MWRLKLCSAMRGLHRVTTQKYVNKPEPAKADIRADPVISLVLCRSGSI